MKKELVTQLAKVIAGLQAPISVGVPVGVALEAWVAARKLIGCQGWESAEEIERKLSNALKVENTNHEKY
jgi:hypothetical protein